MSIVEPTTRPRPDCPLVAAYGLGVDSTAMLVEFARRQIRPDLILFADTGGEKPETYQYLSVIRPFLGRVGFPDVITVRYRPTRSPNQAMVTGFQGRFVTTGYTGGVMLDGKDSESGGIGGLRSPWGDRAGRETELV